ncbi:MAG TPA: hypothetical protein VNO17_04410 [Actinomycetota bacterium]|nr:hypothetical protein [Actinomycetota bacterium]
MPRTPEALRRARDAYAGLGIDLLVFDPTIPDPAEVEALADAVL